VIRPLALALIPDGGRLLVAEGTDSVKRERFFRLLGGGIEFGETGEDAVRRELLEEIGARAAEVEYLATLENIFIYEGERGHELCRIYHVELSDRELCVRDPIPLLDTDGVARWVAIDGFLNGSERLYPDGVPELLRSRG
jgi:ADP-ribose pyrophosphatase YjhB (NUDIX family)